MHRYFRSVYFKVNQELQNVRSQQLPSTIIPATVEPANIVSPVALPTEIKPSDSVNDGNQLFELKKMIQDLEEQKSNLEEDLKMTVIRQREAGTSANEILVQLESEISK
jgi:hypothetical protein